MGVGFTRRVTDTPSTAFLLAIEGVVVIDRAPPNFVQGAGTGQVMVIGEMEDGPFNVATKLLSQGDLAPFGLDDFGYQYSGLTAQNPCARARQSDAAAVPEYWNGNTFIALVNKAFAGLTVQRIDTSVGSVKFTREAQLTGLSNFSFALTSGQILQIDVGGGNVAATFTGVPATITSGNGVFPTTFAGGEQVTFVIDGVTKQAIFLAGDQSHVQAIARLNLAAGYTAFTAATLATILNGQIGGTNGNVQIVSITTLAATALGFAAGAVVTGTGNVGDIGHVVDSDVNAVAHAAVSGVNVDRDVNGNLRIKNTGTPGTGTVKIDAISTATAFGFTTNSVATAAASGVGGVIPAGTRVRTSAAVEFVTMQTINAPAGSAGPFAVKVRHALDDGTGASQNVSTLTVIPFPLDTGAWAVTNDLPISSALTEAALDALYFTAIKNSSTIADPLKSVNIIFCARQSNAIRSALRAIGPTASNNGCNGRIAIVRPPLGTTTRAQALSNTQAPGVGTLRDNVGRVVYAYPGVNTFVPQIASLGLAGGAGFAFDGNVDVPFDSWIASVCSQTLPEENPGQLTTFLQLINGVELGNPDVQSMQIGDYTAFKAGGIACYRQDGGDDFIQSGVTTVDPTVYSALAPISRRRFADFIEDSGAEFLKDYVKRLARPDIKAAAIGGLTAFFEGLKSVQNPSRARIVDYGLDAKSMNTDLIVKQGIFWIVVQVVQLSTLDTIVFDTQVGATVTITTRNQ